MITVAEIADRYVAAFRSGDLEAALGLLSEHVVRSAPLETAEGPGEQHGVREIMDNSARLNDGYHTHAIQISDPLVRGDQFAVRFSFDRSDRVTGKRETTVKMSLYTVDDGAIVYEEVFFHANSAPVGRGADMG